MKVIKHIITGSALLFASSLVCAADLGDLDVTIRVIDSETNSVEEIANELKLPDILKEDLDANKAGTSAGSELEKEHEEETKEASETRSEEPHEDLHERESDGVREIRDYDREREDSSSSERPDSTEIKDD